MPSHPTEHHGFETLIDSLLTRGYGESDRLFGPDLIAGLRQNWVTLMEQNRLKPAGMGPSVTYVRDLTIRSDAIHWIEPDSSDPVERAFCQQVQAFIDYLNRTCYTGITGYEFHYACYQPETYYRRHRDQFRQDLGRQFSLVTYLNPDWQPEDGGALTLYLPSEAVDVWPTEGKTVFFRSDELEHEVKVAHRMRLSVTGWLKRV